MTVAKGSNRGCGGWFAPSPGKGGKGDAKGGKGDGKGGKGDTKGGFGGERVERVSRWWFQILFIFNPTWGSAPF